MNSKIKNMPIFNKIFLFSFMITLVVVFTTVASSFYLQSKQFETEIGDRVEGVAGLWSATFSPEDIIRADEFRELDNTAFTRLESLLTMIDDRNSTFFGSFLVLPEVHPGNKVYILAASESMQEYSFHSLMYYDAGKDFLKAFHDARDTKTVTSTGIFRDRYGSWISSFAPIIDEKGEVVALLGVEMQASVIRKNQAEILFILIVEMAAIIVGVYVILNWGLRKVLKPVNNLFFGINEISAGHFSVRLPVEDQSELGLLSERFNDMADQLSKLFERVSAASRQLGQPSMRTNDSLLLEEAIDRMEDIFEKTKIQQELQRAEKMNAIGQLAASVAHEIRNPMTVVKGFLQIFLAKDMTEEELMYIKLMIEELNRAETIINDYLNLAKPDIGKPEIIDGKDMAEKVMDLMSSYAMMSKNIALYTEVKAEVKIRGNKNELKQVLINILKNGIEAMKDGGKLSLVLEHRGDYGVFIISDTGIGMTEEELNRLGTAFYSLKERGTGMGLMVCYQIIERMKGQIQVMSRKGEGTTFEILLPLSREAEN